MDHPEKFGRSDETFSRFAAKVQCGNGTHAGEEIQGE